MRSARDADLPAAAQYGRFVDIAAVGAAAQALGAPPCAWHRLYLATLAPEAVEEALATLVAAGDRPCAAAGIRHLASDLRHSGAQEPLARARYWLAVLAPPQRPEPALRRLRQALSVSVRQGDRERTARVFGQMGRLYAAAGHMPEAYSRLLAALDLGADAGLERAIHAAMHINAANVLVSMGHATRAADHYQSGLELAEAAGQETVATLAREGLRYLEEQRGDLARAYLYGSAVLAHWRRVGPPHRIRHALVNLARISMELDPQAADSLNLLAEAADLEGSVMDEAVHRLCEAGARIRRHEEDRAVALIDSAQALLDQLAGMAANTAAFHVAYLRADLLLARGEVSGAYEWYRAAAQILSSFPVRNTDISPHLRQELVHGMTAAAQAVGRTEEAVDLAQAMGRADAPDPLPELQTRDVVRAELERVGEVAASAAPVIFLPARAGTRQGAPGRRPGR